MNTELNQFQLEIENNLADGRGIHHPHVAVHTTYSSAIREVLRLRGQGIRNRARVVGPGLAPGRYLPC